MVQSDGMAPDVRAGLIAAAQEADAERLPNLVKLSAEIRKLEAELARLWGTRLERSEVDVNLNVWQQAPVDLTRMSPLERDAMLEAIARDAKRRMAIPAETSG